MLTPTGRVAYTPQGKGYAIPDGPLRGNHKDRNALKQAADRAGLAILDVIRSEDTPNRGWIDYTDKLRVRLADLGTRQRAHLTEGRAIIKARAALVADARKAGIPEAETARLLAVPRSTIRRIKAN